MTEYPKATVTHPQPTITIELTLEQAKELYGLFNTPCVCEAVPLTRSVRLALKAAGVAHPDPGIHVKTREKIIERLELEGWVTPR